MAKHGAMGAMAERLTILIRHTGGRPLLGYAVQESNWRRRSDDPAGAESTSPTASHPSRPLGRAHPKTPSQRRMSRHRSANPAPPLGHHHPPGQSKFP